MGSINGQRPGTAWIPCAHRQ